MIRAETYHTKPSSAINKIKNVALPLKSKDDNVGEFTTANAVIPVSYTHLQPYLNFHDESRMFLYSSYSKI